MSSCSICLLFSFFFFKQKTAYEMRISDWSSDVCSSDLMMMAMLRVNVPSIFVYGGSILPGRYEGRDVTVVDVFEAVGQHAAGHCPLKDLTALEKVARSAERRVGKGCVNTC